MGEIGVGELRPEDEQLLGDAQLSAIDVIKVCHAFVRIVNLYEKKCMTASNRRSFE